MQPSGALTRKKILYASVQVFPKKRLRGRDCQGNRGARRNFERLAVRDVRQQGGRAARAVRDGVYAARDGVCLYEVRGGLTGKCGSFAENAPVFTTETPNR